MCSVEAYPVPDITWQKLPGDVLGDTQVIHIR